MENEANLIAASVAHPEVKRFSDSGGLHPLTMPLIDSAAEPENVPGGTDVLGK